MIWMIQAYLKFHELSESFDLVDVDARLSDHVQHPLLLHRASHPQRLPQNALQHQRSYSGHFIFYIYGALRFWEGVSKHAPKLLSSEASGAR